MVESGKSLLNLPEAQPPTTTLDKQQHYKTQLRRKDSPCIVITDTSGSHSVSKQQSALGPAAPQHVTSAAATLSQPAGMFQGRFSIVILIQGEKVV